MWYSHNHTTICSALIFLNILLTFFITGQFTVKILIKNQFGNIKRQGRKTPALKNNNSKL